MNNPADLIELNEIYELLPNSTCLISSCAEFCCTKMKSNLDDKNTFMPLPLIYGIEFLNILNFLRKTHGNVDLNTIFDFSKKTRICPFKDKNSCNCKIYEARPFSCRVYGMQLPPVFWGVEVEQSQADSIYCKNLKILELEKFDQFLEIYPNIWDLLAKKTFLNPIFSPQILEIIEKETQIPGILILAFGEYYFLLNQNVDWFNKNFTEYWKIFGKNL